MTRDELRAALIDLDAKILRANEAAIPARAVLRPFEEEIDALSERRELLLEGNEAAHLGGCFSCAHILFEGDIGCKYGEDGDYLCAECSPTLGEALKDWECNKDEDDAEETIAIIKARIAAEGPDVKLHGPL